MLAEVAVSGDGGIDVSLRGTFDLMTPSTRPLGSLERGFVSATIRVWPDGTIYGGSIALEDVPT